MAHSPLDSSDDATPTLAYERIPLLRAIRRLNASIYDVERVFVITALLIMSAVVFLDVYFRFLVSQRGTWRQMATGDATWVDLWPIPAVVLIIAMLFNSAWRTHPIIRDLPALRHMFTVLGTLAMVLLSVCMLLLPSRIICAGLVLVTLAILLVREWDLPRPIGSPPMDAPRLVRLVSIAAGGLIGLWVALNAPEGYSWALRFALFLMLWMAFIGASMATWAGRHLRVDAVRKLIPDRYVFGFNAVSSLLAGTVTAAFAYLAVIYFQRRLGQQLTPGEIPEWVKTLAIPFSLVLITLRFYGQAIVNAIEAALSGSGEPARPAATEEQAS